MTIQHPATFVRRSVYEQVGLFNTSIALVLTMILFLRCLKANISWIIIDDVFTRMRAGGKGGSAFTFEDWKIRRFHKLSSGINEAITSANSFVRHFADGGGF